MLGFPRMVAAKLVSRTALAATVFSLAASPAFAQAELEEIVVTAQKREEGVMDVPIAVSVTTAAQIERDQIYTLTDLQRTTPALEVSQTFGGETTGGGRIRGIGTQAFNDTGTASVAIVIDDLPAGNTSFAGIYDLAQVEVLRGPQGTLFGQTASAGVINITTADPNPEAFDASIGVDFSDKGTLSSEFGQNVFRGMVNVPISDTSAFRVAAFVRQESGIQENVVLDKENEDDSASIRAKYLAYPTDNMRVELTGEYNKSDVSGRNFFAIAYSPLLANPPRNVTQASYDAYTGPVCGTTISTRAEFYCSDQMDDMERTVTGFAADLQWDFGDSVLTLLSTVREMEEDTQIQEYSRNNAGAVASDQQRVENADFFSAELRLTSALDGPLNYITGVYYSDSDSTLKPTSQNFNDPFDPVGFSVCISSGFFCVPGLAPSILITDSNINSIAAYGDLTYDYSDRLTLFGGLRFTHHETSAAVGRDGPPTNSYEQDEDNLSGRLGFRFNTSDSAMIYGTVSRGFKGQLIEVPTAPTLPVNSLEPEISTGFELGYKATLNDTMNLEANIFHTEIDGFQTLRSVFVGTALISVSENIDIETQGIELTLRGIAGENFEYSLGYIYNDAPYPSGFVGADGGSLAGEQFIGSPKSKFTFSGEYFTPFRNMEWFANFNGYWKDDVRYEARSTDNFVFDSHFNIGASVGLRSADGTWRASLFGRNLTAEREPIAFLASTWLGQLDGGVRAWPAGGVTVRQVGLSLEYNFGN